MKRLVWSAAIAAAILTSLALTFSTSPVPTAQAVPEPGVCGPMDVAFVIDTTGSMGGAHTNVQAAAGSIINDIDVASGSDFQLSLVTFKDNVLVENDLAAGNEVSVQANIAALVADGGAGAPEASDEALNTVINGLDAADRLPGQQTGDFDGAFRAGAVKIIILITDAPPGGFDDTFLAADVTNAHNRALEAAAADILISAVFVPTGGDYAGQAAIMADYASTTGGSFVTSAADGAGTADAIAEIIAGCGRAGCPDGPISPANVEEIVFPGDNFVVEKCVEIPDIPAKADVYFLADTTGSMDGTLAAVQADSATILGAIATGSGDAEFGAGDYKDAFDAYMFQNTAGVGPDDGVGGNPDASDAIAAWSASGGGDAPEGQLFALHEIATEAGISYRADATKFVVWFGDNPGHDPICDALHPDTGDLTEASVTAELVTAGVKVIAISVTSGFGLDADPTFIGGDYVGACGAENGAAGQATRIAAATGGAVLTGVAPEDIADAILEAIGSVSVEVEMQSDCTNPITTTFEPTSQTVPAGGTAIFIETIAVAASAPGGTYECDDTVLIDGELLLDADDEPVTEHKIIKVPEGFLTGGGQITTGRGRNENKISFGGNVGFLEDFTLTGQWQTNFHNVSGTAFDKSQFHSTEITSLQFFKDAGAGPGVPAANANVGSFTAVGRFDHEAGWTLKVCLADRGEGKNKVDSIRVQLFRPDSTLAYDSLTDFPSQDNTLSGTCANRRKLTAGNFQIHSGVKN